MLVFALAHGRQSAYRLEQQHGFGISRRTSSMCQAWNTLTTRRVHHRSFTSVTATKQQLTQRNSLSDSIDGLQIYNASESRVGTDSLPWRAQRHLCQSLKSVHMRRNQNLPYPRPSEQSILEPPHRSLCSLSCLRHCHRLLPARTPPIAPPSSIAAMCQLRAVRSRPRGAS